MTPVRNQFRRFVGLAAISICVVSVRAGEPGSASLSPITAKEWDLEKAAHLLRRAGFDGTPEEIHKLFEMGLDGAVDHLVDYDSIKWDNAPPFIDPTVKEDVDRAEMRKLSDEERQALREQNRKAHQRTFEEVRLWWIDRMVASPRPFEEKMTLFWHGHFTSGMREVKNSLFLYEQNQLLRRSALGRFRDLLVGISKDRAMLSYLDNRNNVRKKPNENYARELMELFTLGVGNYGEDDIKAAARAFTGWSFNQEGFVFREATHDDGIKNFLGRKGKFDGYDIIDAIVDHPACSRFLSRNLLEFFCRPKPDKELIENFALLIRKNEFAIKPAMKALFKSKAFYHADSRGALIKSPVELLVSSARQFGVGIHDLRAAERAMAAMGQEIMQPPNVKGWDGGPKWINTATLFNRYNFVGAMINGNGGAREKSGRRLARVLSAKSGKPAESASASSEENAADDDEAGEDQSAKNDEEAALSMKEKMAPESRLKGEKQPSYDPMPVVRQNNVTTPDEIVDHFAKQLLAVPLASAKREQLIAYLAGDSRNFDFEAKGAAGRIRTMINLLVSTPEYQMY